jgi:hypothetical protein
MKNNIELTKFQHFKQCIDLERKDDPTHFMWVGEITEEFLNGVSCEVDGDLGSSKATRYMLQEAIREFYIDFDRNMYDSLYPRGLFTDIVWGKFRALERKWKITRKAKEKCLVQRTLDNANSSLDPDTVYSISIFQSHIVQELKKALKSKDNEHDSLSGQKGNKSVRWWSM